MLLAIALTAAFILWNTRSYFFLPTRYLQVIMLKILSKNMLKEKQQGSFNIGGYSKVSETTFVKNFSAAILWHKGDDTVFGGRLLLMPWTVLKPVSLKKKHLF